MIVRIVILSLALTACAHSPADREVVRCQRQSPPWATIDCPRHG